MAVRRQETASKTKTVFLERLMIKLPREKSIKPNPKPNKPERDLVKSKTAKNNRKVTSGIRNLEESFLDLK